MAERSLDNDLIPLDFLNEAADCLKCLAHPGRLRIIDILRRGDYSVEEVARQAGLSQPATSAHLRLMQNKGLLSSRRLGRTVYYSVASPQVEAIFQCIRSRYQKKGLDVVISSYAEDQPA